MRSGYGSKVGAAERHHRAMAGRPLAVRTEPTNGLTRRARPRSSAKSASSSRVPVPVLSKIFVRRRLTVSPLMPNCDAMSRFPQPSATADTISRSRGVKPQRPGFRALSRGRRAPNGPLNQLAYDLAADPGLAPLMPNALHEKRRSGILQENAPRAEFERLEHLGCVDARRQQQNMQIGHERRVPGAVRRPMHQGW